MVFLNCFCNFIWGKCGRRKKINFPFLPLDLESSYLFWVVILDESPKKAFLKRRRCVLYYPTRTFPFLFACQFNCSAARQTATHKKGVLLQKYALFSGRKIVAFGKYDKLFRQINVCQHTKSPQLLKCQAFLSIQVSAKSITFVEDPLSSFPIFLGRGPLCGSTRT